MQIFFHKEIKAVYLLTLLDKKRRRKTQFPTAITPITLCRDANCKRMDESLFHLRAHYTVCLPLPLD